MNCEIVQDLLPLYVDDVCSEASREEVERHIETCDSCRMCLVVLKSTNLSLQQELVYREEAAPLRRLAAEWKRLRWKSCLKGAGIVAVACLLILAAWYALFNRYCIPMTQEDYTLRTYQLADGSVGVHVKFKEGRETHYSLTWKKEDGVMYFYMARPVIRNNPYEVDYSNGTDSRYPPETGTAYFGLGEDAVLLMEDGVAADHPAATEAEEQKWSP